MLAWNTKTGSLAVVLLHGVAALVGCNEAQAPVECQPGQQCDDAGARPSSDATVGPGGASTSGDATVAQVSDLPCDVKAVVDKHCAVCHTATGSAPMALTKRADFLAASPKLAPKTISETLPERLHSTDSTTMMPPAGYPRPSEQELSTLETWLSAGAAAGSTRCDAPGQTDGAVQPGRDGLECFRFLAHDLASATAKYKVGQAWDSYVNMTFKASWPETRYGVTIRPVTDNAKVLHHWLLFQNLGPGVDGAVAPAVGAHPDGALVAVWAPGGTGLDFTKWPDVGYELPGGDATYTIEFHYNSNDASAEDASGAELCMVKTKPKNVAGVSWLGKDNLLVPMSKWVGTCAPLTQEPIRIMGVMPHMHLAGTRMTSVINRKDGSKETLHDEPFNFEYQRNYDKDVTLMPGDTITTECTYSKPTMFGKETTSEMCYLFTYAYPKGALAGLDPVGACFHGGSSCLGLL